MLLLMFKDDPTIPYEKFAQSTSVVFLLLLFVCLFFSWPFGTEQILILKNPMKIIHLKEGFNLLMHSKPA